VVPFNDWGAGYCANVTVSTTSAAPVDWRVTFVIAGRVRELWSAAYTAVGSQITAEGLSWNNLVTRTQPVTFGFCALR
jgi:endoglucanase